MVCEELDLDSTVVALLSHAIATLPVHQKNFLKQVVAVGPGVCTVHSAQRTRVARPSRHRKEFGGTWTEEQLFDA